jgi:hypothetical protein
MFSRYFRTAASAALLLVLVASGASAAVLWDQSNWNQGNEGSVNLSSTSCSQISGNTKVHNASDVTFTGPVVVNTVRIYETLGNVEAASQAYLYIAPKTGPAPTDSSTKVNVATNIVPITISYETINSIKVAVVTASNLNRALPAGDYWVSLTPRHSLGLFPYTVHLVTSGPIIGSPTYAIVACTPNATWTTPLTPPSYDYAIKIEGDQVVPTTNGTWGGLKAIYR